MSHLHHDPGHDHKKDPNCSHKSEEDECSDEISPEERLMLFDILPAKNVQDQVDFFFIPHSKVVNIEKHMKFGSEDKGRDE